MVLFVLNIIEIVYSFPSSFSISISISISIHSL